MIDPTLIERDPAVIERRTRDLVDRRFVQLINEINPDNGPLWTVFKGFDDNLWERMEPNPKIEACIRFLRGETSELPAEVIAYTEAIFADVTKQVSTEEQP